MEYEILKTYTMFKRFILLLFLFRRPIGTHIGLDNNEIELFFNINHIKSTFACMKFCYG